MKPSPNREKWVLGGTLYLQGSGRSASPSALKAHLRIVNGKIDAITKKAPTRFPKGVEKIDATGLTILPGFVQAHVHLCQTLFRNLADDLELLDWLANRIWPMEAAHTEETLRASALLGIHELLSSGTTCILDMGTVRHTESIFEVVRKTGIRASVGKCLMDHPETTPTDLREPTRDALAEARALYERWNGTENDRIRVSYAPRFVISCTEQLLTEVARLAREQKALIHTHASENLKEIQLVKKLVDCENIEYLHQLGMTSERLVLAHCIWLKPNEKRILARSGTHVVHCPSSNMKLASGLAHIPDLRARGVNVALGADGAPCNNNLDQFREMRMAALLHKPGAGPKAMRAQEVLDMATRAGARALGWWDDIGSIEIGKKADLIALDLNTPTNAVPAGHEQDPEAIASSVVYSSSPAHLSWTMVDGRVLFKHGKVRGIPAGPLMEKVRRAQTEIARSIAKKRGGVG
ncbi:MAG: 5'-deoxyadenosine deaminase [Oligoflexia bacterium]|nr:5'-deoxyadenosine deaminase [Oligoflexia bacterium]